MELYKVLSGLALLTLGRRLFWLFVALTGFLVGAELADDIFIVHSTLLVVLVALGAGLLGAIVAIFAQRLAFALGGFFAGAYIALVTVQSFGAHGFVEVFFLLGGIAGALLSLLLMDVAIVVLSSLVGAGVIVDAIRVGGAQGFLAFTALVTTGILIQAKYTKKVVGA